MAEHIAIGRYYCSKSCQVADWPSHKLHHKELARDYIDPNVSHGEERDESRSELILKASIARSTSTSPRSEKSLATMPRIHAGLRRCAAWVTC